MDWAALGQQGTSAMNFTADGNEFVHFDEYEDAVVAIKSSVERSHVCSCRCAERGETAEC